VSTNLKTSARTGKRRSGLRFQVLNAFVDEGMKALKPAAAVVWLVLYRDTRPDGIARTAADDIARRTGLSRSTVLRSLKSLERARMLRVIRRGGLNRGPSIYRIFPFPVPDEWG